ncbi:MAG TPA: hypothetical protein VLM05_02495, partial [Mycobacteriales bacterium]|nr:hypothetical protein [Mycobacteriales bacterium]
PGAGVPGHQPGRPGGSRAGPVPPPPGGPLPPPGTRTGPSWAELIRRAGPPAGSRYGGPPPGSRRTGPSGARNSGWDDFFGNSTRTPGTPTSGADVARAILDAFLRSGRNR